MKQLDDNLVAVAQALEGNDEEEAHQLIAKGKAMILRKLNILEVSTLQIVMVGISAGHTPYKYCCSVVVCVLP